MCYDDNSKVTTPIKELVPERDFEIKKLVGEVITHGSYKKCK